MSGSRTALVIGAGGALGSLVADAFESAGWTVQRAGRRAADRPGQRRLDLDAPATIAPALEGADVVVSTVPHEAMAAERAVLERGGLLLLAATPPAAAVTSLRAAGEPRRGTVVVHCGLAPGITNLATAELVARHPEADTIEIALTFSAGGFNGRAGRRFTHRTLTTRRRHRTAVIAFAAPIGRRRCLAFAEQEDGWLGPPAEGRSVRCYLCFGERPVQAVLLALNRLGAIGLMTATASIMPTPKLDPAASSEPVRERVAVYRGGRELAACSISATGDYRTAAQVMRLLSEALLDRGAGLPPGCFTTEELLELRALEPALAGIGVTILRDRGAPEPTAATPIRGGSR